MNKSSPPSAEPVKTIGEFYRRELITVPVVKVYPLASVAQRCGLRAAVIELDTVGHPNIDYVAGTRLNVYPINSKSLVQFMLDFLVDDLHTIFLAPNTPTTTNQNGEISRSSRVDSNFNSPSWVKFIQQRGSEALRLALTHLVDLANCPSRELLRYIGESCALKTHRLKLESITSSEESWERYVCQEQRTLKTVLEEFNSAKRRLSAKKLIIQELLPVQQPRQYSISNIKSSRRFRAEIIVFQHKFSARQIALNLRTIKEHQVEMAATMVGQQQVSQQTRSPRSPASQQRQRMAERRSASPGGKQLQQLQRRDNHISSSVRSIRSMAMLTSSPISSHQVRQLPVYSGPLMSLYAASSLGLSQMSSTGAGVQRATQQHPAQAAATASTKSIKSIQPMARATADSLGSTSAMRQSLLSLPSLVGSVQNEFSQADVQDSKTKVTRFDGLCSNYLLNLQAGEQIICEFLENPRFTLKGNRERPIMMIAQDVGLIAFRPFWQQRHLEHDRAQIFYTLFKDLSPKRFGDMNLVCLTGNKCRVEELFKKEINAAQTNRVLTSVTYINRQQLLVLLDLATQRGQTDQQSNIAQANAGNIQLKINSKELLDLGYKIYKLLVENNGCLYTCCDPHMTQAIEILVVECMCRYNKLNWTYDHIMTLLPKWKGRKDSSEETTTKLENIFERAQIVQEIYDNSI